MSEPEAWPKVEMTELERKLLDAAKADRIPGELALRMASALSAPSVPPPAAGTSISASAGSHAGLLFSKTGLWGFLSLTLLAGAGTWYATQPAPRTHPAARVAPATRVQAETTTLTQADAPAAAVSTVVDNTEPSAEAASAASHVATLMNTGSVAAAPRDGSDSGTAPALRGGTSSALHQEIGLLDRAREALQRGAPQRALSLLDQHQRRFAHGTLVPEAEAMRIETLVRLGASERAQRLSRRFLAAYPAHPLHARVSAVTAAQPVPLSAP